MLMEKMIFAFDLDGTLLNSSGQINNKNIEAIKQARELGHLIIIATGRPFQDIQEVTKLNIFDYAICNNGSYYINTKTNEIQLINSMPKEVGIKFIELSKQHEGLVAIHFGDGTVTRLRPHNDSSFSLGKYKTIFDQEWHKFVFHEEDELIEQLNQKPLVQASIRTIEEEIPELYMDAKEAISGEATLVVSGKVYVDANPVGISKATAIEEVAKTNGLELKDVIAFGDSGNDMQMIARVGMGIAMDNGIPELKDAAQEVIGDNDSDAIGEVIMRLIK